ncbi:hypothetical protein K456DRAFT_35140 [Colletotrichum gloeosporioides 23]|nr:hypothetical protein K456DRAFT_35140 [Colletotrichum gloeosporioides 23]
MVFGATQSEGVRGRSHLKRGASAVKPSTVVRHELAPRGGPDQFCVHSGCACPGREHASMPLNAFAMAGGWMINTTSPVRYGRVKSCPPSVVATSPSTMTLPGSLSGRSKLAMRCRQRSAPVRNRVPVGIGAISLYLGSIFPSDLPYRPVNAHHKVRRGTRKSLIRALLYFALLSSHVPGTPAATLAASSYLCHAACGSCSRDTLVLFIFAARRVGFVRVFVSKDDLLILKMGGLGGNEGARYLRFPPFSRLSPEFDAASRNGTF